MLVLALLLILLALAYYYFTSSFSYWKDRNVEFIKPYPLVGSIGRVMAVKEHFADFFQRIYNDNKGKSFVGFFQGKTPALVILDPTLVKNILVKDFAHFTDHGLKFDEEADPLEAKNLFNMCGHQWKDMRSKLTPTFTSGRMKAMFPLVQICATQLKEYLGEMVKKDGEFETREVLGRYTTDVIGSCVFGIQSDSLRHPNCEFRVMGKKLIDVDFWRAMKILVVMYLPELSLKLRLALIDIKITNFFRAMVRDVIEMRKKTGEVRKDFMQLLIELQEHGQLAPEEGDNISTSQQQSKTKLTHDDLTAQATVFFIAGFETSSTVMSFALLELAMNPDIQVRARQEIEKIVQLHGGELDYQAMQEMKYIDYVLEECMRKYPPVASHQRVCTKKYLIPDTDVTIDKGTIVTIPAHALQNDPQYFPDPDRFDPARFSEERCVSFKNKCVYLPFGDGPRKCIGTRFAMLQSKLGLITVLRNFEILPSTRTKYPIVWDPRQFILNSKDGIWVQLVALK